MSDLREELDSAMTDMTALERALLLAHDHHVFGPEECTPENCSAEEVIQRHGLRIDHTHGEKRPRRAIALGSPFDNGHTHADGEPCDPGCI